MIFIFSNKEDRSTNDVIYWLSHYGVPYKRINKNPTEIDLRLLESFLLQDPEYIGLDELPKSYKKYSLWFRRPDKGIMNRMVMLESLQEEDVLYPSFDKNSEYYKSWENNFYGYRHSYLTSKFTDPKKVLGSHDVTSVNKIQVLRKANEMGIRVPKSIVTNNPNEIKKFAALLPNGIICKTLYQLIFPIADRKENFHISNYTKSIEEEDYTKDFYPSLIQENIIKKYEVRTFILDGECHSAALWSQSSNDTAQDFRAALNSSSKPRRTNYKLPDQLEKKIINLALFFGLNSCSIDIMKGIDDKYYFLEINPVGQFGFISGCINRQLEKKIAQKLIEKMG